MHQEWRDANGRICPSVTTVTGLYTSKEMLEFRGDVGNKRYDAVMDAAAAIGTRTHAIIEDNFERDEPTGAAFSEEREAYMADQAFAWAKENVAEVVAQESGIFSTVYRYGGTADLIARLKPVPGRKLDVSRPVLVDWKTSTEIYATMGIQLSAYANLYNEAKGLTWQTGVKDGLIVRLDKRAGGPPVIRVFNNLDMYFEAFKGLRVLWDIVNAQEKFAYDGAQRVAF